MEDRTEEILEAAVREFINSGEPVSSSTLYRRYEFGIKPAMIRHELNQLTDLGYLEQPYHSAGRVPADKGYEFYADRAFAKNSYETRLERELSAIFENQSWPGLASWISGALHGLGVVYGEGSVYKDGLDRMFDNLEWEGRDEICQIIKDYEELDRRFEKALATINRSDSDKKEGQKEKKIGAEMDGETQPAADFFIGRKSPLTNSERLAVVAGDYRVDGERVVVCLVGPKRLDYERAAAIFRTLKKIVGN